MKRFILTGTPGAGKTSIIALLQANGHGVVRESATDLIARFQQAGTDAPWRVPGFVEAVLAEQIFRIEEWPKVETGVQYHDRSPFCTVALSAYLGFGNSPGLQNQLDRLIENETFDRNVFFIENMGFIETTSARQISYADALVFEQIHRDVYTRSGFHLISIPPLPVEHRVAMILKASASLTVQGGGDK